MEDETYCIAIRDGTGWLIYGSEAYNLSEIDLINLIKICFIEARSKSIGRKLIEIYRDSTKERKEITQQRLNQIGINENKEPIKSKKARLK